MTRKWFKLEDVRTLIEHSECRTMCGHFFLLLMYQDRAQLSPFLLTLVTLELCYLSMMLSITGLLFTYLIGKNVMIIIIIEIFYYNYF